MAAPEKIYVRPKCFEEPWPPYVDENSNYGGIEYTRTDTFIEKACNKLAQLMYDQHLFENRLHQDAIIENFVGYFRNYMKGE